MVLLHYSLSREVYSGSLIWRRASSKVQRFMMFTIDNSKAKSTLQQHWILKETLIVHLIDVDQSSRSVIYDLRGRGESWWWSPLYEMAKVTSQAQGSWQTEVGWWSRTHALPDAQSLLIWVLLWPSGKAWNGTKVHGVQKPEQELSNFEHWKTPWFAQLLSYGSDS